MYLIRPVIVPEVKPIKIIYCDTWRRDNYLVSQATYAYFATQLNKKPI